MIPDFLVYSLLWYDTMETVVHLRPPSFDTSKECMSSDVNTILKSKALIILNINVNKKIWNRVDFRSSEKKIQNTQEIKRTLLNWTKQDKTWTFSKKSAFSSYVQDKNRKYKQLIQLILCQLDARRLVLFLPPYSEYLTDTR